MKKMKTMSKNVRNRCPEDQKKPLTALVNQHYTIPTNMTTLLDRAPSTSDMHNLLNNNGSYRLPEAPALIPRRTVESAPQPATSNLPATTVSQLATSPSYPRLGQRMRNGKIARLPKLERDMVNKLLYNHVPYSKIVWALEERGITVTERNISNWRTRGGYKEWCAEQENQLRLAHLQDHLTDYLRKHDAQQLPEVGLQIAATQLTSLLMNPQTAAPLLADPAKYALVVNALDKCSVRLSQMQKDRYEDAEDAGIRDTIPNLRCKEARQIEDIRELASAKEVADSPDEDNVPHRNDLPPREAMPYSEPKERGPSFNDIFMQALTNRSDTKRHTDVLKTVTRLTSPGNRTDTHGNPR
jgi:hypothetical protein